MTTQQAPPWAGVLADVLPDGGHPTENTTKQHCHNTTNGMALQVAKRGRWVTVGKVVMLHGEWILAIAIRRQPGTAEVLSVPLSALAYAERWPCRLLYYRRDDTATMRCIALACMRAKGWVANSDGVPELFVKIADLEPVPWRKWAFVKEVVQLDDAPPPTPPQLGLWGVP